jgi:hypothetical protein
MREELLNCPFCGSKPNHGRGRKQRDRVNGEPFQRFVIWCHYRHATVSDITPELAIAAWNTRAPIEGDKL